uniref:AlNc14C25G2510 protein n=1 Tax=Albugo laibachii Nc14 TaxID=890382 RepID=F0W6M2_9STRA|nr:AlNc14C25G2510 [Albugo laibachii Nc14]|eukprot:CCA16767.1 AlNc14C25G2510 [Albugo laibachii Nc14]
MIQEGRKFIRLLSAAGRREIVHMLRVTLQNSLEGYHASKTSHRRSTYSGCDIFRYKKALGSKEAVHCNWIFRRHSNGPLTLRNVSVQILLSKSFDVCMNFWKGRDDTIEKYAIML